MIPLPVPTVRARRSLAAAAALACVAGPAVAQDPPAWTRPIAPVRLLGPIWYVGTQGLAAYLIKTDAGAIVIDGTLARNVPAIRRNIEAAGVPIRDVRWLLLTHAHFDHAGGIAGLQEASGAKLAVGARDATAMRTGVPPGETSYGVIRFAPARVDRAVRDGDVIRLGGVALRAVATPGHTPGCTSWQMRVRDAGRLLTVVFPCSVSVAGNRLIGNRRYPGIVGDYRASFARLAALPADVVLDSHPERADVLDRARDGRLVAPGLLREIVLRSRDEFDRDCLKQSRGAR